MMRKYGSDIVKNLNFILLSCFVQVSSEPPFKVWEYVKELWAACVPVIEWSRMQYDACCATLSDSCWVSLEKCGEVN